MTPRIILLCLAVLGVPTMGEAAREERLAGRTPDLLFASGHKGRITGLAWSPDGKSLATSSADGSLRIWDPTLGATRRFSQEGRKISCIAWSPDGKRLAVGADGMVRVWSTTAWRLLQVLPEHDGLVTALSWRPDGLLLAAGDWHGKIRISNPETGAVRRLLSDEGGIIGQLAWNPNGKLLAAAGSWGRVAIWDLGTGQVRVRLPDVVGRVGWNPDGKILGVASRDGVRLWDLARGKIRYTIPRYEGWLLAWRPDWLMRAYDAEGRIRIEGAGLPPGGRDLGEHPDPGHGAWSADGKLLATAAIDGSVRIWEIPSGKCRFVLDNHGWGPEAFALSPDGKTFAISTEDGALHLWAPGEGEVRELRGHWNRVFALAWSPDGKRLASAGMDRTVRLWDAATGAAREVLTIDTELIRTLIWSPDGTRLILDDPGGAIRIWSPATDGVSRLKLQTRWSAGLVSSPDG
ncbi:MAG TPA: WD40 repeat domain-containing protein, partial [Armatimonadota bacterium]|nr:WD40 repeat domain-containing protein [Armatimonadota bacterium]